MIALPASMLLSTVLAAAPAGAGAGAGPDDPVTFNRDIAPIVFANCSRCHRPGESAPFNLLTYRDVRKRARQIAVVTGRRFMPPWLPKAGRGRFRNERGLTDEQIGLIKRWAREGTVEGDPADLPPTPTWTAGWQLGEPDLVVPMPEEYTLRAEGFDDFRNFVIPIPVTRRQWVKAVELRPGNPQIVHHAVMQIDRGQSCRRLDDREEGPGFSGMEMGRSVPPDGHFLGWTPGRLPYMSAEGTAWRLEPGTDLVLQLHMLPSGKPETIRPVIGFFFAPEPPTRRASLVLLRNDAIDIPPGVKDYLIEDAFELPAPVKVLGIYPHAHYIGKDLRVFATLPDGSRRWLLHIDDWDFNWQDEYRYVEPVDLPAGATLLMQYTYDNSADNERNPSSPPRRVVFGRNSTDEMGTLTLQVLPANREDAAALDRGYRKKVQERFISYATTSLEADPNDPDMQEALGSALLTAGRLDDGVARFEEALRQRPEFAAARRSLGGALGLLGRHADAIVHYRAALEAEPEHAETHNNLGVAMAAQGDLEAAVRSYREAVRLDPGLGRGHANLSAALVDQGKPREAIEHLTPVVRDHPGDTALRRHLAGLLLRQRRYERAIEHFEQLLRDDPGRPLDHISLAAAYGGLKRLGEALYHYREALQFSPGNPQIHVRMGMLQLQAGRLDGAIDTLREGLEARPDHATMHGVLANALVMKGMPAEAVAHFREASRLEPGDAGHLNGLAWILATSPVSRVRDAAEAVEVAERAAEITVYTNVTVLDTLAAAYASARRFDDAIRITVQALGLAAELGDNTMDAKLRSRLELYRKGRPYRDKRRR